jgi:OmpA-OmpF porin, OOP family
MKTRNISRMLSLAALAVVAGTSAGAQEPGWYLGGNVGRSMATIDDARIGSGLAGGGLTMTSIEDRDRDKGFKVFGGYQFNRYLSFEGGWFDLGKFGFTAATLPLGTVTGDAKVRGANLDLVITLPFTQKFAGLVRIGGAYAEVKDTFSGTGLAYPLRPAVEKRELQPKAGVGLQYQFTPRFGMRLEAERTRINDAVGNLGDVDLASIGFVVRFPRRARAVQTEARPLPQAVPMAETAPVAVVEMPVAVAVPAPAPARSQIYCSVLDLTFEIDNDEIQRDDKEKLAVVGVFMTKYPNTTAVIEGHADSVGSAEHNQALSERRARGVMTYLVDTLHIAPSRLSSVGYGNTRPIADNGTEEGKRANRRIDAVIACATDIEGLEVLPARITMALTLEFDRNKADVKPEYEGDLRKVAKFLEANPTVTATVEGHTANLQATPELAMEISRLRARNVVDYLVQVCHIERSRLKAEGYGETRRAAYDATRSGQEENRRVNIIFNYKKQVQPR